MSATSSEVVTMLAVVLGALVVPWLAMRMIVPTLERSASLGVRNYRGRMVASGLGRVWVVWCVGMLGVGRLLDVLDSALPAGGMLPYSVLPGTVPFVLVLGAFAFGFADDVYGSTDEKGFRGHLRALLHGRMSTGSLKLLGIGLLAAVTARSNVSPGAAGWKIALSWTLEFLAIALTANLVNLLDLRPGRALKFYSAVAAVCALSFAFWGQWVFALEVAVALLGPVLAVWRFDLGERGMLGDAGANAMGVLLGWVVASILAPAALGVYVIAVLALNVVSERISFSRVIERNRVLSWLDRLGRLRADLEVAPSTNPVARESSPKTSHHSETDDG